MGEGEGSLTMLIQLIYRFCPYFSVDFIISHIRITFRFIYPPAPIVYVYFLFFATTAMFRLSRTIGFFRYGASVSVSVVDPNPVDP
jgi:hypothetical protein